MSKKPNPADLNTLNVNQLKTVFSVLREADPEKLNIIGFKTPELIVKNIQRLGLSASIVEAVAEDVLAGKAVINLAECLDDLQLQEFAEAVKKANEKQEVIRQPRAKSTGPSRTVQKDVDHKIVVLLTADNPKRPGSKSWKRFEKYVHGATVTDNLKIEGGMIRGDISWDTAHGIIKLVDPGTEVPARPVKTEATAATTS